jgi:hypothetical protein
MENPIIVDNGDGTEYVITDLTEPTVENRLKSLEFDVSWLEQEVAKLKKGKQ